MARVIVKESSSSGRRFFNGTMPFADVCDMIEKIGKVEDGIGVTKGTFSMNCSHNIHDVHIYKDGISYEIHLTENQFDKLKSLFKEMGEIRVHELFWWHHR